MKKGLSCLSISLGLLYLPLLIYGSWLLYNHVHATEIMWFIWWVQLPFLVITSVLSKVIDIFLREEK